MTAISRLMVFPAAEGKGDELAAVLVRVSDSLQGFPGCHHWVVHRAPGTPDTVYVTEVWASAETAEAAMAAEDDGRGTPTPDDVAALLGGTPSRTDLVPEGGVGLPGA